MKKNFFRWALISLALLAISFAPTPEEESPTVRIKYIENMTILIPVGQPYSIDIAFTNTRKIYIWPSNQDVPDEIDVPDLFEDDGNEHTIPHNIIINEYDTYTTYQVIAENKYGEKAFAYVSFVTPLPPLGAE